MVKRQLRREPEPEKTIRRKLRIQPTGPAVFLRTAVLGEDSDGLPVIAEKGDLVEVAKGGLDGQAFSGVFTQLKMIGDTPVEITVYGGHGFSEGLWHQNKDQAGMVQFRTVAFERVSLKKKREGRRG